MYLNYTDVYASTTSLFTLLIGIFFLDDKLHKNEGALIGLLVVIVLLNIAFLVYWGVRLSFVFIHKAQEQYKAKVR